MKKVINKIFEEKYFSVIIILIASAIISLPLINKKTDISYDDGIQHICRLIGTTQSIKNGNLKIMSEYCNGFGYSWNLFYSPLTAFTPLIFRIFGTNFSTCIRLFEFVVVFLSGYFMYLFTRKVTKNRNAGLLSAILYILMPYRFTDMYIRVAISELTSFVFLPLVFLGLYNLLEEKEKNKSYVLTIGAIGLVLTHTVLTMYTAIFSVIYILLNLKKLNNKKIIKYLIINTLIILTVTAFYWMPLLELKNNTQYEVFKEGRMERTEVLVAFKLDFYRLFFTKNNDYMIYETGWVTLLGIIFTPFLIKKIKKEKYFILYLYMFIVGILTSFMTLKIFPFEKLPSILKMLQFSFRLLEFSGFFLSFVAAVNFMFIIRKMNIEKIMIFLIITLLLIIPFYSKIPTRDNYDEQRLIDIVPVTENTGRVHAGCASFEYLPSKAFDNLEYIKTRNQNVIVLEGNALIENEIKNESNMSFDITTITNTQLELPYIYYPGYNVILKNNVNNESIKIRTYETENGFVGIDILEGYSGKLIVNYEETLTMKISTIISIMGITITILIYTFKKIRISEK